MKKLISVFFIVIIIVSCSPASQFEPTNLPENTATFLPTKTQLPSSTPAPTLIPTPTLSPDPNIYECAENVSKEDCDSVKEYVRLARYYLVNNLGGDISTGVKIIVDNIPSDKQGNVFSWKKGEVPYIYINTGEAIWVQAKNSEFEWQNKALIGHEFTHFWQYDHGCMINYINNIRQDLILEGMATWVGLHVAGITPDNSRFGAGYSDERALGWWQATEYDWREWFQADQVPTAAVKHLVDDNGEMALRTYCDVAKETKNYDQAFQSAFGLSFEDFRIQFMDDVLGTLKDCTVATCGEGVDNFSDKYKIGHLIDQTKTAPNLIVHFIDQNGEPVILTHVNTLRQNPGAFWDYAQPIVVPGIFSQAMFPGRYAFFFCEPGYPTNQNTANCHYHETEWFDVFTDEVTELTFQLPLPIENPDLSQPNLKVTLFDENGAPIPDLEVVICSDESSVRACSNPFAIDRKTDGNGIYEDSVRDGKYQIRIAPTGGGLISWAPFYQIPNIEIKNGDLVQLEFRFPSPNLIIKLTDVNGSPIPGHEMFLCRLVDGVGDCSSDNYLHGTFIYTDDNGVVQGKVDPGEYYILTCTLYCALNPPEFIFEDIIVIESQVTNVDLVLSK